MPETNSCVCVNYKGQNRCCPEHGNAALTTLINRSEAEVASLEPTLPPPPVPPAVPTSTPKQVHTEEAVQERALQADGTVRAADGYVCRDCWMRVFKHTNGVWYDVVGNVAHVCAPADKSYKAFLEQRNPQPARPTDPVQVQASPWTPPLGTYAHDGRFQWYVLGPNGWTKCRSPYSTTVEPAQRLHYERTRLRDEMAMAALPMVLCSGGSYAEDARSAYQVADAMLKAREK